MIYIIYSWYIPGIYFDIGIYLVYTRYIPSICQQRRYRRYMPHKNFDTLVRYQSRTPLNWSYTWYIPPAAARLARREPVHPLAVALGALRTIRRRWPSRCTRGTSPSTDRALGMRPRSGHYPTGVQRRSARYNQARNCHVMTTCFSQSKLVFAAKLAMSSGARYGKSAAKPCSKEK